MRRAAAASLLVLAWGVARGEPPAKPDYDDRHEDSDGFWASVLHPNRARYRELVEHARVLMANVPGDRRAEASLLEAAQLEPDEPYAHFLLGENYHAQRRYGECAEQLLEVDRIDPEYAPPGYAAGVVLVPFRLGFCFSLSGKLEESIEAYGRVVAGNYAGLTMYPAATVHWNVGDNYHALGRLEDAIEEYRRAIDRDNRTDPNVVLRVALAVAYDRDEQISNARDAVLDALKIKDAYPKLILPNPNVVYLPPEDQDYYVGLVEQVDFEENAAVGRRIHAIARFRRYVADAGEQLWVRRANQHLAELGSPAITEREIEVTPADAETRGPIVKAILAAAPDLQKCLEGSPHSIVTVDITAVAALPQKGAKPATPAAMRVSAQAHGPEIARPDQVVCITDRARQIKVAPPTKGALKIVTHLVAAE